MSDKYTTIRVPVGEGGFCCQGYVTRAEAIKTIRSQAEHDKAEAERILATADDDFVVEQHTGYHVRRNIKVFDLVLAQSLTAPPSSSDLGRADTGREETP